MPDREVLDPVVLPDSAPPPRKRFLRVPRVLRRRVVVLPALATLLLGLDAWMVVAIQGWQDQSDTLRSKSVSLGESLAQVQAEVESVEAETELLTVQKSSAEVRVGELTDEAAAERARMDAFLNASLDFGTCATDRLGIIKGLWEHGRGSVADLEAPTSAECAAAQATLDGLMATGG